jgi:hypothetical protein
LVIPSKSGLDNASVVAEEAHIVAQSPNGPRGDTTYPGDVDHHENLILLCRIHHKMIDDQVGEWPVARLREVKSAHEAWVVEKLSASPERVRLIPDPAAPNPSDLQYKLAVSGGQLWNLLKEASSWNFSYSEAGDSEEVDQMVDMLDEMSDWADISSDIVGLRQQREVVKRFGEIIDTAAGIGYVIYTRRLSLLLTGGAHSEPWPWIQAEIFVPRADILFESPPEENPGEQTDQTS